MGDRRSTPSSARERYYRRRVKRTGVILASALVLALAVCGVLAYPALAPVVGEEPNQTVTATQTPVMSQATESTVTEVA